MKRRCELTEFAPRRAAFRQLHKQGCFVLPNPLDAGSARRLEKMGFKALASSSSAAALSLGLTDYQISLDECLAHLRTLVAATDLPVNADFENGFGDSPEDVAANVLRAIATGIAIATVVAAAVAVAEIATANATAAAGRTRISRDPRRRRATGQLRPVPAGRSRP